MESHDPAAQARAWAASGLMALTGPSDGPPAIPPGPVASRLQALSDEVQRWTRLLGNEVRLDWTQVFTARVEELGLRRQGQISANGSCRLLPTADGWMALNLARADDYQSIEALTGHPPGADPWAVVAAAAHTAPTDELVGRARLLGLAAAPLGHPAEPVSRGDPAPRAIRVEARWPESGTRPLSEVRVVDLSSLWAGPLAARILMAAGADVTKLESEQRPDGARATPKFFESLHPPGQSIEGVDLHSHRGLARLREVLAEADVVIEASRPRALEQLRAGPDMVRPRPGRVWLSISGYGRADPGRNWVAFGDDAAVAGGLVAWDDAGTPVFCGDAIADPISGLMGASAILQTLSRGGGRLLGLSMSAAAAGIASAEAEGAAAGRQEITVVRRGDGWAVRGGDGWEEPVVTPPGFAAAAP